jgi:hypothetical protein
MIQIGECSDTLRSIGRYLEIVGSSDVTVVFEGDVIAVSWQGPTGRHERRLDGGEVEILRASARLFRGTGVASPLFGTAQFLRTVGREIDTLGAVPVAVAETVDGFWARYRLPDSEEQISLTYADLVAQAQAFHRHHRYAPSA